MQLWESLLLLCTLQQASDVTAGFLQRLPRDIYVVMPGIPAANQTLDRSRLAGLAKDMANYELTTSDEESHAAQAEFGASMANLVATNRELQSSLAAEVSLRAAQNVERMKRFAEDAAEMTKRLVDEIPVVIKKNEEKAVGDTVKAAIARMNVEAGKVVEAANAKEAAAAKAAANNAQAEALPFQQAKLRAGQTMVSYLSQARELAIVCNELQKKAFEISKEAIGLQQRGNPVASMQMYTMARDLMDKSQQMQAQAKAFDGTANKIKGELGGYGLAAGAAAAYGAYVANPGGQKQPLPPLPWPLQLPPPLAPGPAPGPAPQ